MKLEATGDMFDSGPEAPLKMYPETELPVSTHAAALL